MTAQLLLSLSLLVTVHELGHFVAARFFKIKVERFYIFFDFLFPLTNVLNFSLLKYKRGDTEYGLGWFPLGGYVKIAGMADESGEQASTMSQPQPWEFRAKPAWQRLIVMMGGIATNVVLGVLIFIGTSYWLGSSYVPTQYVNTHGGILAMDLAEQVGLQTGDKILAVNDQAITNFQDMLNPDFILADNAHYTVLRGAEKIDVPIPANFIEKLNQRGSADSFVSPRVLPIVGEIAKGSPAERVGLQPGDRFISLNGIPISYQDELRSNLMQASSDTVSLTILRAGSMRSFTVDLEGEHVLGCRAQGLSKADLAYVRYSFGEAILVGVKRAFGSVFLQIKAFGKIFSGQISLRKSLSGPIGIAKAFGAEWDWERFWQMTGLLSMALAFMNILPIPALDGGHAVFLLYEMVTGRELPERLANVALRIGMALLMALMAFVFYNDIVRLFSGS